MSFDDKITEKLEFLYDSDSSELLNQIKDLIAKYDFEIQHSPPKREVWDENDAVLIAYGDTILPENGQLSKLEALEEFVTHNLQDAVSTIHILPFFPYSSDKGFSVIDYKRVRHDLGDWEDIERLSHKYDVMADLVINHISRFSDWFENYQISESPGKDYFIEVEPGTDISDVTRPRDTSLLTTVKTDRGLKYVWTTFSDDQIDLDFSNPEVLLEFIDIFLFYLSKGITVIRLDAIAYLWKKIGTNSIHLEETHQIVKLYRDIIDHIAPNVTLITETNVPFDENVSYFGDGDEAHMIYQFSLPPLLLHALLTENGEYLTKWASELPEPPEGCTYFNFTASHDGIGVRPLEGLVPEEEVDYLVEGMQDRGGFVSYKEDSDGTQSPYELNITYFDAFEEPGKRATTKQVKRYMCSQIIMLSLQGVPGIYFHNLIATRNYLEGVKESGSKRDINRKQWQKEELEAKLKDRSTTAHHVLKKYRKVLMIRRQQPAFNPEAKQEVMDFGDEFFAFTRNTVNNQEKILCISNLTSVSQAISSEKIRPIIGQAESAYDLLSGENRLNDAELRLDPYETVWLKG